MWIRRDNNFGGTPKFFRLSFGYENLGNFFQTNFALMQHHKYSLTELENMLPWEREVYIGLLVKHLERSEEHTSELQSH